VHGNQTVIDMALQTARAALPQHGKQAAQKIIFG
jgi:hypothetical protein